MSALENSPGGGGMERRLDLVKALKEAGLAGLVAIGLTVVMVGFRTVDQPGGLGLRTRWEWVALAVAAVVIGRFLLQLRMQLRGPKRAAKVDFGEHVATFTSHYGKYAMAAFVIIAVAMPFFPGVGRYHVDIATLVVTYIMLGWGLNIVVGLAGLLDLGYVAFYAVGAYSYALIATHYDWSFWVCLPLAGAFAAFFGVLLGFPVLRLRGDYLAIVTLGFGEIVRIILLNWYSVTNGPDGVSNIPRPSFFGLPFERSPSEGIESFHSFFGIEYSSLHRNERESDATLPQIHQPV